jgi:hypothetical protein
LEEWEDHDRKLSKFIRTNTKPHIFYLPAKHNDYTLGLLEKTAGHVEGKFEVHAVNCGFQDYTRKDVVTMESCRTSRGAASEKFFGVQPRPF